jgi:hypothetical protein
MTPRAKKLLAPETKNTSTKMPGETCESTAQHLAELVPRGWPSSRPSGMRP